MFLLIPITVFATLVVRDSRSRASHHQGCYDVTGDYKVTQADVEAINAHFNQPSSLYDVAEPHDGWVTGSDINFEIGKIGQTCNVNVSISASSTSIVRGQSTTLNWSSQFATAVSISGIGGVGASGSRTVAPTTTTTYTITATNPVSSKTSAVTINVSNPTSSPAPKPPAPKPPTSSTPPAAATTPSQITIVTGSNGWLVGNKEIILSVEGTNLSKKVLLKGASQEMSFDTTGLVNGTGYNLKVSGQWILTQKIPFTFSAGMKVNLNPLKAGDVNTTDKIDDADVFEFLNGFVADKFYDLNVDGVVNSIDYSILAANLQK